VKVMLGLLVPIAVLVGLGLRWHWLWWAAVVVVVAWAVGMAAGLAAQEGEDQAGHFEQ
jgi:hypothetical protein